MERRKEGRQIKFRAWDEVSSTFALPGKAEMYVTLIGTICSTQEQEDGSELVDNRSYRFILQQFTGLQDKNGKEIYEGDLLSGLFPDDPSQNLWEVAWTHGGFYFKNLVNSFRNVSCNAPTPLPVLMVIGNIYENPELIPDLHHTPQSAKRC